MKKFILYILFIIAAIAGNKADGQVLLDENFNYPVGDSLGAHGWVSFSGGTTNVLTVSAGSLVFPLYVNSGIGGDVRVRNTGQDAYTQFTADSAGSDYFSFLVRVDSAFTGDYFLGLLPNNSTSNYTSRLWVKDSLGSVMFGLSKSSASGGPIVYTANNYAYGTTYLLVIKYTFNTGSTTDDEMRLFIMNNSIPPVEPSPTIGPVTGTVADAPNLSRVALRQGSVGSSPVVMIDGIRVSKSWSSITFPVMPIDSVRAEDANGVPLLLNQTVTVRGVVTTHHELGTSLVYFESSTAGLIGFDTAFCSGVTRGDSVLVTGKVTQFNGLTELQPVYSYSIIASARTVNPVTVTPSIIRNPTGEQYEGMLIKINGITQVKTTGGVPVTVWTVTGSGTNYRIFAGSDSCDIRIYAASNIANTNILAFPFNVTAVQSQFSSSPPYNSGYQVIPRDLNDFAAVTGVTQTSTTVPNIYSLKQNYPNPFNPATNIEFNLPKSSFATLKIFDILGREIETLVNDNLQKGAYKISFNASNYASGIYYYKLTASGNVGGEKFIETKAMILVK